jgi:hypothetical protein
MLELNHLIACAACQPDPGSPVAGAASGAIYVMLGAMTIIFSGLLGMVISIARRTRAAGASLDETQPSN